MRKTMLTSLACFSWHWASRDKAASRLGSLVWVLCFYFSPRAVLLWARLRVCLRPSQAVSGPGMSTCGMHLSWPITALVVPSSSFSAFPVFAAYFSFYPHNSVNLYLEWSFLISSSLMPWMFVFQWSGTSLFNDYIARNGRNRYFLCFLKKYFLLN